MSAVAERDKAAVVDRIHTDPLFFADTILGHDLWTEQRQVLAELAQPNARVAIKACHASSKTYTAAEATLWTPYAGGVAVTTATTGRQVKLLVWNEIQLMYPRARYPLGGRLLQTEFHIAPDRYAIGFATRSESQAAGAPSNVSFQGFHARPGGFLLIVVDEAPGVDPAVFTAIDGISAGGDVRVLVLGNPDVPSGPFYDIFLGQKSGWQRHTIDAFGTPNFVDEENPGRQLTLEDLLQLPEHRLDYAPRPYLVTRRWVREKYEEWFPGPLWESKVRGNFPQEAADALIALKWLYEATQRVFGVEDATWTLQAGLDVAGPGEDETVLRIRRGPKLLEQHTWATGDTLSLLTQIRLALAPHRDRLGFLVVDAVGIGYHLGGSLAADYGQRVVLLNVAERSRYPEMFTNLKAELYWGLRDRFHQGDIGGPLDELTQTQLASLRYNTEHHRGLVEIESKDQARKRGVKSPDRAEALMLAFAPVEDMVQWPTSFTVSR
jgi:phage terminase large subunit